MAKIKTLKDSKDETIYPVTISEAFLDANGDPIIPQIEEKIKDIKGADGKSAYQFAQEAGYTGTETEFGAKLNQTTFANPFPLTFTGAASATYDGSSAVTVDLPSGGSVSSIGVPFKKVILGDADLLKISGFKAKKIVVFGEVAIAQTGATAGMCLCADESDPYGNKVAVGGVDSELKPFFAEFTMFNKRYVAVNMYAVPNSVATQNSFELRGGLRKIKTESINTIFCGGTNRPLSADTWMQVNIVEEA